MNKTKHITQEGGGMNENGTGVPGPDGSKQPHTYGPAVCNDCGHRWTAVWPLAADALECPKCHSTNTDREQSNGN